jgi:hypothetical protein
MDSRNKFWLREFFLVDGKYLSYQEYLRRTFYPLAPSGVHLIVLAPKASVSSLEFEKLSQEFPGGF